VEIDETGLALDLDFTPAQIIPAINGGTEMNGNGAITEMGPYLTN
jgi:hypothetical protein